MKKFFCLVSLMALSACSAPDMSRETLEKAGYTDIQIEGWAPMTCGEDDKFSTAFTAQNPQGTYVSGVVCCGLWKSCTVRF